MVVSHFNVEGFLKLLITLYGMILSKADVPLPIFPFFYFYFYVCYKCIWNPPNPITTRLVHRFNLWDYFVNCCVQDQEWTFESTSLVLTSNVNVYTTFTQPAEELAFISIH